MRDDACRVIALGWGNCGRIAVSNGIGDVSPIMRPRADLRYCLHGGAGFLVPR